MLDKGHGLPVPSHSSRLMKVQPQSSAKETNASRFQWNSSTFPELLNYSYHIQQNLHLRTSPMAIYRDHLLA
jgi:hypothetical protein